MPNLADRAGGALDAASDDAIDDRARRRLRTLSGEPRPGIAASIDGTVPA